MLKELSKIIELNNHLENRILSPKLIYNELLLLTLIMHWFKNHKILLLIQI